MPNDSTNPVIPVESKMQPDDRRLDWILQDFLAQHNRIRVGETPTEAQQRVFGNFHQYTTEPIVVSVFQLGRPQGIAQIPVKIYQDGDQGEAILFTMFDSEGVLDHMLMMDESPMFKGEVTEIANPNIPHGMMHRN